MAHIGSFEWNMVNHESNNSPELYRIFEFDKGTGFNSFMNNIHPDDRSNVEKSLANAMQTGNYECEYRYVINGKVKYIWSKGLVIYNDTKPYKLVGTVQDITERKKAERELQEKTVALERSNESLQQFAYVASHDLKEPIRKISTFTDLILIKEQNGLSESSRKNLEKVYHSSVRMRQMIDDIMAYSTLIQWEEKVKYPVEDVLKEALDILEQSLEEKNAVVEYNNLPEACFVPAQFRQLFQNLISNSLKFSKPGEQSIIKIEHQWLRPEELKVTGIIQANSYLQLVFTDNGIGFDQNAAEKIFSLFSRLHSKTEYEGSGLGLAIAKRIVDNHNGIIYAHGEKGKGASFTVIIPQ
jgi:light-regulated signal transduction histidine kinase (bacteriophytochrome)